MEVPVLVVAQGRDRAAVQALDLVQVEALVLDREAVGAVDPGQDRGPAVARVRLFLFRNYLWKGFIFESMDLILLRFRQKRKLDLRSAKMTS